MRGSVQLGLAVLAWLAAGWPLVDWYIRRVIFIPGQAWLALAPVTALVLVVRSDWTTVPAPAPRRWLPSIILMGLYAAAYGGLPMTLRALLAAAALLFLPGPWRRGFWPAAPVAGLCLIGLPAVMMLQFYFGFPLQVVSAALAVPFLRLAGFDVVREGALLSMQGHGVGVDAACSGIQMGWSAFYLALALCGLAGLGWRRTAAAVAWAGVLVLAVNALRVAALFGVEIFGLGGRPLLHTGVGVMLFLALAAGAAGGVRRLSRGAL